MTLVVGIIAKDGIVLASDSRATSDLTSNDKVEKIIKLHDHFAVGISGDGALGIHLLRLIHDDLIFTDGIVKLVEKMRQLLKGKFDDYFSHTQDPAKRPSITFMVVGYEKNDETPEVYELRSSSSFAPRPSSTGFNCIGMPFIAEYLLNRFYEKEITTKQAEILATFCIKETESQSHEVGGDFKVASFSNTKNFSMLSSTKIKEIMAKCDKFYSGNKAMFYPENEPEIDNREGEDLSI